MSRDPDLLARETVKLRAIIDSIQEGVVMVDPDHRIAEFSRRAEEITGYRASMAVGSHPGLFLGHDFRLPDIDELSLLAASGPFEQRRELVRRDGRVTPVAVTIAPVSGCPEERCGFLLVLRDLSRDRRVGAEDGEEFDFCGIISRDPAMGRVLAVIEAVASSDSTVLITGESGTGKELVARAVHSRSGRAGGPFVAVNCAALSPQLLESEFFGHVRGAFTGASADKQGRFEQAGGGTLFLDEIAELPLDLQPKLLRALQSREIERVGSGQPVRVDVRLIAATNRDLERALHEGGFRHDLFYRLSVIPIAVPPLRDRPMDIEPLAMHFIRMLNGRGRRQVESVEPLAMKILLDHRWPGNVRELENVIEYAHVTGAGPALKAVDLPASIGRTFLGLERLPLPAGSNAGEERRIRQALALSGGNRLRAAGMLGISRVTLWRRMRQLGIE